MTFRLVFLAAFVSAVVIAARTARGAARVHGGSLNQRAHAVKGLVAVRATLGLVLYGALGAWLIRPGSFAWADLAIPSGWRWLAAGLLVTVLVFFDRSYRALGDNCRGGVGLHAAHALVTTGAYA